MNALLQNILSTSAGRTSNKDVIRWWEQRRIYYNIMMLVAGTITIMLAVSLGEIRFSELLNVWPPLLIFALSANLFYTLGWVTEIACLKFISNKEIVEKAGPVLFIAGISFSVLFTFAIDIALIVSFFFENQNAGV